MSKVIIRVLQYENRKKKKKYSFTFYFFVGIIFKSIIMQILVNPPGPFVIS